MDLWAIDPWGEQRADMRMAKLAQAMLMPHSRARIDAADFMLFPDDAHDLPDGVDEHERQMMLKLGRLAG